MNTKTNLSRKIFSVFVAFSLLLGLTGFSTIPAYAAEYSAVTSASVDYTNYSLSAAPSGLNISYYDTIYSRGFAWMTDTTNDESKLYIVASDKGQNADFSSVDVIVGTCDEKTWNAYDRSELSGSTIPALTCNVHKAHVTGLSANTTYSYKVGGTNSWEYGVFTTESSSISSITAIQISDAQTLDPTQLNVWENTVAQAIETAGTDLDMILYNGDMLDQRMTTDHQTYLNFLAGNNDSSQLSANQLTYAMRLALARDTVDTYVGTLPYMTSVGNHEPYGNLSGDSSLHVLANDIDYGVDGDATDGMLANGGYYSYDYGFAHFVVLDTQDYSNQDQITWLEDDLTAAENNSNIKWIIVMMHVGAYATGDHSNGSQVQSIITTFTPIFSDHHVDLVLQAHDHTYSKTLPYLWDAAGYTEDYNETDVVNFSVNTVTVNGTTYDVNPNGTYYVTTGSAGHRNGDVEKNDGCWADVTGTGTSSQLTGLVSGKTFTTNKYKIEVGTITQSNSYNSYTVYSQTADQVYNVGDPATGNVNAEMFGVLTLTEDTLTYNFYTVDGDEVKLFDTLNVMKVSETEKNILTAENDASQGSTVKSWLDTVLENIANFTDAVIEKLRELVDAVSAYFEGLRETAIDNATSGQSVKVQLQSVQASAAEDDVFNIRLIAGTSAEKDSIGTVGFKIYKDTGSGYGDANTKLCNEVYSSKVEADATSGFDNEKTVTDMNGGNLFALTINDITATGNIKLKVVPYGIDEDDSEVLGKAFVVEIQDGFVKSVTAAE